MKASHVLRKVLLLAAVVGLVWCLVVFYWHATDANPSSTDLALYLGVLPLGLVGSYWLLRSGIDRLKRAPAPAASSQGATTTLVANEDAPADGVLALIASAVLTPVGAGSDAVARALVEPARPGLHARLKDRAGLPVLAAEVDGLDTDAIADALDAITSHDHASSLFPEERLRALALLDPVADELLLAAFDVMPTAGTPAHARAAQPASKLSMLLLLPATWPQPARQLAADWLQRKAVATGLDAAAFTVESLPMATTAAVWTTLAAIGRPIQSTSGVDGYLVLAADTHIDEASVERLQAQARLFGTRRQEGLIPGEAAAGVLLVAASTRLRIDAPSPRLHRIALQRRVDNTAQSKAAIQQLAALMQKSLAISGRAAEKVTAVISDADHRPSRSMEIGGAVSAAFPELDLLQKCLNLGVACGHTGIAAPLATLAVAAAQVVADGADAMVVGLGDDETLASLVVSPAPSEPSTAAADRAAASA